tara:strand:- start:7004 stop:8377 length:1374 start_codon:yes stop_codon:yes gene_type:complete
MNLNRLFSAMALMVVMCGLALIHVTSNRQSEIVAHSSHSQVEDSAGDFEIRVNDDGNYANRSQNFGELESSSTSRETMVLMNDPNINQNWGLAQTDAAKAWSVTQGSKKVVVAVIDTGIDVNHPDIRANLWVNPDERRNDKFGFRGDIHGWNFVDNNADLTDNHGHGTHIAGIIGAVGGNKIGITGIAPKVSLMILKYYDPKSTSNNNLKNTIRAFEYAIDMGADIINYSGGGLEKSPQEEAVIKKAKEKGILVVAAAGNESSNSDVKGYYPADYDLDNIISVTAIDRRKNVLSSSNFGVKTVDIAAPGNDIYSTLPRDKGGYGVMTGTSQATAFVSGVAALIKANNADLRAPQIIKYLKHTGDVEPSLASKTRYKRKINTYRALTILDQGMGVTGVRAENTASMKSSQFSSERQVAETSVGNEGSISGFGSALLNHVQKTNSQKRIAEKPARAQGI